MQGAETVLDLVGEHALVGATLKQLRLPFGGECIGEAKRPRVLGGAFAVGAEVYAYLLEREQPTETYIEARRAVRLADGRRVEALVFLSDVRHTQWAGRLSPERQAELIAGAKGLSGPNVEYLRDLVHHLREEGVHDHAMERLLVMVEGREHAGRRQA